MSALAGQSVDGVIVIAPREDAARGLHDLRPGLPVVAVEAGFGGEIPVVSVDQFAGAQLATDHLLDVGHRTVWHVAGPDDWLEARERLDGWRASLARRREVPPPLPGDWSAESGYRAGATRRTGAAHPHRPAEQRSTATSPIGRENTELTRSVPSP